MAIGSNIGFGLGAIALSLATYNFIRDPLPESSAQLDKPREFDDPRKQHPPKPQARDLRLDFAPYVGQNSGGVVVGGKF
jgi:hypothetical protein